MHCCCHCAFSQTDWAVELDILICLRFRLNFKKNYLRCRSTTRAGVSTEHGRLTWSSHWVWPSLRVRFLSAINPNLTALRGRAPYSPACAVRPEHARLIAPDDANCICQEAAPDVTHLLQGRWSFRACSKFPHCGVFSFCHFILIFTILEIQFST